jgi:adenylate cyclase class 2
MERRETEVKLRMDAPRARFAARLRSLGASLHLPRHFEDNRVLDDARQRLYRSGSLLRLRVTPHGSILTYKGPRQVRGGIKSRFEVESEIRDPDALLRILTQLGLRPVFRYQKFRTLYRRAAVLIALDETPIGNYLEMEGSRAKIISLSKKLDFEEGDFISKSYYELFVAFKRRHNLSGGDMTFGITARS